MRLRARRGCAGFRLERESSSAMRSLILDLHEVANLPEHTEGLRRVLALDGAADLPEPKRAQRAAMALRLADLASYLGDSKLRHSWSSGTADIVSSEGTPSSTAGWGS